MTALAMPCRNRSHSPRLVAGVGWSCPQCESGFKQPEQAAAISRAKDAAARGMSAAVNAHPNDASRVAAAIRRLAATGRPFSANDARQLHGVRGGVVGATFNALRAEGLIAPVGAETSTDKGTHGKSVARWIGRAA